jgi:cell division protein FtsB
MIKWFAGGLFALTVLLQYRIWLSDDGVSEAYRLRLAVLQQTQTNSELRRRNDQLAAEVTDLKNGMAAIEERARSELGMVGQGETFYQVVPKVLTTPGAAAPADLTRTAQR